MTFSHRILDENSNAIYYSDKTVIWFASLTPRSNDTFPTPAQVFAYSLDNGLSHINLSLDIGLSPHQGISVFLYFLNKHPYFSSGTDPNNSALIAKLTEASQKPSDDKSALGDFMKSIPKFIVPGVKKASIISDNLEMQDSFDGVNFPDDIIPANYKCCILLQVMSSPCKLSGNFIDVQALRKLRREHQSNPFTRGGGRFYNRE